MDVSYFYRDDRYEKEGDLAREGYVHNVRIDGDYDELLAVEEWCQENLIGKWLNSSGSQSFAGDPKSYHFRLFHLCDIRDAFILRLYWS